MASPPAKRQRRSTVFSSEGYGNLDASHGSASGYNSENAGLAALNGSADTYSASKNPPASQKRKSASKSKTTPKKAKSTPTSTPSPGAKQSPKKTRKEDRNKSLHAFFGRATEEQRWSRKTGTDVEAEVGGEDGDSIEDDDSLDEVFTELAENGEDTELVLDRRKDPFSFQDCPPGRGSLSCRTQKFIKPVIPSHQRNRSSRSSNLILQDSHRPWADRYGPINIEELAVHKRKVADVQTWLMNVLSGRQRSVCAVLFTISRTLIKLIFISENSRLERSGWKRQNNDFIPARKGHGHSVTALVKPHSLGFRQPCVNGVAVR